MRKWLNIMVISCAVFAFLLVVILLRKFGENADRKERRINYAIQKDESKNDYEELNDSFFSRVVQPKLSKWSSTLGNMFPFLFSNEKSNADVAHSIRVSGLKITPLQFNVTKTIFMLIVMIITVILSIIFMAKNVTTGLLILAIGLLISIMMPRMYLNSKIKAREKAIRNSLPEVIDLLSVSMTAGLSFDGSVKKVTEKMTGPFITELKFMYNELQMGRPKRDALKHLGECCDLPELKNFVAAVIQADQMGIPIKNILAVQSQQLREDRKVRAREQGQKAPVKMLFPLIFFIFPVIFIILLGPAFMNISQIL